MSSLSHPLADEIELTIAYPDSGPHEGYAVLHATGCKHTARRSNYGSPRPFTFPVRPSESDGFADDYWQVAPCARKVGA
jgi:hypothetical protein